MKKWLQNLRLGQQLAAIIGLFAMVPTILLGFTMVGNMQKLFVQSRLQEVQLRAEELRVRAEKGAELCNMSTQVFLNTPDLLAHLTSLKNGVPLSAVQLLDFYNNDIASLEKVVLSNPYLYQIRVFSVCGGIQEMMPILYGADRMQRLPWAQSSFVSGTWQFDHDDQLFASYPVTHHITSLVTGITAPEGGRVGVLEVALRMDTLLPELYTQTAGSWAGLVDARGALLAGHAAGAPAAAQRADWAALGAQVLQTSADGKPVLLTVVPLEDFGCTYLQVTGLEDIRRDIADRTAGMITGLVGCFLLLMLLVNSLTKRMLRGYYSAFDCVRAFSDGDMDASMEVTGSGEIARFAAGIQQMLDNIRRLMQSNTERELLVKNTEIRALQNQINAHFIYNVLESIKMMAEVDGNYEIADAVTSLGKLLRYSMRWSRSTVSLFEEIDYIKNYLALMNLRFDDEIRLALDVPDELTLTELPKISLQPLVENAVVHGGSGSRTVRLSARRDGGDCLIEIADDGCGLDAEALARIERQIAGLEQTRSSSGNGIGLRNVQERLQRTFGPAYGITVQSCPGAGTTVTVRVPCRDLHKEEQT